MKRIMLLVVLALGLGFGVVAPALASIPTVLYVGNDHATCPTVNYSTVQDAINASVHGVTKEIRVCTGTYAGFVVPPGKGSLKIVGVHKWTAYIQPYAGSKTIVEIQAHDVILQDLTVTGPGSGGCDSLEYGVLVGDNGLYARVLGNQVIRIRDNPISGCQNGIGVRDRTGTAVIQNNNIRDYQKGGIVVSGHAGGGAVNQNTVSGVGFTGVIAQNGIQLSDGAISQVNGNVVSGNKYTGPNWASTGILLYGSGGARVLSNQLFDSGDPSNDYGFYAYQPSGALTVQSNHCTHSTWDCYDFDGVVGAAVSNNTAFDNQQGDGFWVSWDSYGNSFSNNTSHHSYWYDCEDNSSGFGSFHTANHWFHNQGDTSSPPGICTPGGVGAHAANAAAIQRRPVQPIQ